MKGVVLVNIGSPDAPDSRSAASYLRQFLMDGEVMRMPYLFRHLLVNGIIVPFRKNHTASLYQEVWTTEGAPLKVYQNRLALKLTKLTDPEQVFITQAMRYGQPDINHALSDLKERGITEILFILLYPQNTGSTVASARKAITKAIQHQYSEASFSFIDSFYDNKDYQSCLINEIQETQAKNPDYDKLLFTYHGVPISHLPCPGALAKKCNAGWTGCLWKDKAHQSCYRYQCYQQTVQICQSAGFETEKTEVVFQSRLGKGEWLKPYLSERIVELPAEGTTKVAVIAPSFPVDCLETLHEIKEEAKKSFFESGGSSFLYISCLNDREEWCNVLSHWINCWLNNVDISKSRVSLPFEQTI